MASRPVPMIPKAKTANANSPATGRSASAAWAAVAMVVTPRWLRVTAVATTMHSATAFENSIPTNVSSLIRDRCRLAVIKEPEKDASGRRRLSSASCEACQKNRYGLIVVPSTATTMLA